MSETRHLCKRCAKRNRLKNGTANESECELCKGIFLSTPTFGKTAIEKLEAVGGENRTFSIGTRIPKTIEIAEERLWEDVGISKAEALKAELNREIGKFVENNSTFSFDPKCPNVVLTVDVKEKTVHSNVRPLFVFGRYKKKIPMRQTKRAGSLEQSVEAVIEEGLVKATGGKSATLHGAGREDIDALMLGSGRPFVAEIKYPKIRRTSWEEVENSINRTGKGVEVIGLKQTEPGMVELVKKARFDKTYEAVAEVEKPVNEKDLKRIKPALLMQRTPIRVSKRRADLIRKRRVKEIEAELVDPTHIKLIMTTDAGTYVKEFISGDEGRTVPSVTSMLGKKAKCVKLIVTRIHSEWLEDFW
jgi:tRNA pseudouridine synthase 10